MGTLEQAERGEVVSTSEYVDKIEHTTLDIGSQHFKTATTSEINDNPDANNGVLALVKIGP
jgi:hypothetical protein